MRLPKYLFQLYFTVILVQENFQLVTDHWKAFPLLPDLCGTSTWLKSAPLPHGYLRNKPPKPSTLRSRCWGAPALCFTSFWHSPMQMTWLLVSLFENALNSAQNANRLHATFFKDNATKGTGEERMRKPCLLCRFLDEIWKVSLPISCCRHGPH